MERNKTIYLVLADDDSIDRELFTEAVKATSLNVRVDAVAGGQELFTHLQHEGTRPDIIFLDLNMPVKDGRETLRDLKAHQQYRNIPVIILSTSSSHFDVLQSYNSGASFFISKPHDFNDLIEMLRHLLTLLSRCVSVPD